MNEQLVLGLSLKEASEKEDFFISSSNLGAVTLLGNTDRWGSGVLLLVGPKGSGKTHLSLVWCKENKARHVKLETVLLCLLYTSPSPRDATLSRMPSSA